MLSGNVLLGQLLETFLRSQGDGVPPVTVVLDAPWDYAYRALEATEKASALVVTDNPCGEYWDDLWDLGPTVLIAKQLPPDELLLLIEQAAAGTRQKLTPFYQTPLTRTERKVLRLCAFEQDLKRVAEKAGIGPGTLKNHLSRIYDKLGLQGLVDLGRYYFGGAGQ